MAVRTPRRVDLERGDLTGPCGGLHLVEARVEVTEVRGDHIVNEYSRCAAVSELRGELLRAELIRKRQRGIRRPRVRNVRKHRDRRVTREEQIMQIDRTVRAFKLVRGTARRDHAKNQLNGLGRVLGPRSIRSHMVSVHVDDELAATAKRMLASLDLVRGRHRKRTTRTRGRRPCCRRRR